MRCGSLLQEYSAWFSRTIGWPSPRSASKPCSQISTRLFSTYYDTGKCHTEELGPGRVRVYFEGLRWLYQAEVDGDPRRHGVLRGAG